MSVIVIVKDYCAVLFRLVSITVYNKNNVRIVFEKTFICKINNEVRTGLTVEAYSQRQPVYDGTDLCVKV